MKAYITLISSESYLEGVIGLNKSLLRVGSAYPLYCMVSSNMGADSVKLLEDNGINTIVLTRKAYLSDANNADKYRNWDYTFDKLFMWGQTRFEKIVFIDADMIVVRNIDHLFDAPAFSASKAGIQYPGCEWKTYLNSGLIVLTPDLQIMNSLLELASTLVPGMRSEGQPVGDQDIINAYVPDWPHRDDLTLDDGYNLFAQYIQYYRRHLGYTLSAKGKGKGIYVIHYVGLTKPWMVKGFRQYLKLARKNFPNVTYLWLVYYYNKMRKRP